MSIRRTLLLSSLVASTSMAAIASENSLLPALNLGVGGANRGLHLGIGAGGNVSVGTPLGNVQVGAGSRGAIGAGPGGGAGAGIGIGTGINLPVNITPAIPQALPVPVRVPTFTSVPGNVPQQGVGAIDKVMPPVPGVNRVQQSMQGFQLAQPVRQFVDVPSRLITSQSAASTINAPAGKIIVDAGAEVLVRQEGERVRVQNLTGIGQPIRLQLGENDKNKVVVLDPGKELVVGKSALKPEDVRPPDGIARRNVAVDGNIAVSDIHLPSLIHQNKALSKLITNPQSKEEKRIGERILKTAAALLTVQGTAGFEIASSVAVGRVGPPSAPGTPTPSVPNPPETPVPPIDSAPPAVPGGTEGGLASSTDSSTRFSSGQAGQGASNAGQLVLAQAAPPVSFQYDQTRPSIMPRNPRQDQSRISPLSPAPLPGSVPSVQRDAATVQSPFASANAETVEPTGESKLSVAALPPLSPSAIEPRQPASALSASPVAPNVASTISGIARQLKQQATQEIQQHPYVAFLVILLFGMLLALTTALAIVSRRRAIELQSANLLLNAQIDERVRAQNEAAALNEGLQAKIDELNTLNDELVMMRDRALEGSRLKSEFVANISHEIRTPITAVLGMIGLLKDSQIDKRQSELVQTLDQSARSLLTVINDILDFSKIEAGMLLIQNIDFSLQSVLHETVEMLDASAAEKGLALSASIDSHVQDSLHGDPFRLRQILLNLLGNAIKFTPKGTVSLTVRQIASTGDTFALEFFVKDTGIGISENVHPLLFQPFAQADGSTTRRFGGTGLGLSISKRLVELMGGKIGFTSVPGKGSEFWFMLPFSAAINELQQAPQAPPTPSPAAPAASRKILVAEDSPVLQRIVKHQLDSLNCETTIVSNGREAIEALESEPFDLVLMDWQMPELDGIQATRQIRNLENRSNVPIIAMTANAMEGDRLSCLNAGMNDYISKPFTLDQLRSVINTWMPETKQSSDETGA